MHQLSTLPDDVKCIVVYDESGVVVSGIIRGLAYYCHTNVSVVGITTKREPYNVISRFLGVGDLERPDVTFWYQRVKQTTTVEEVDYQGIHLFKQYDAHCVKFLERGDMLWVCGSKIYGNKIM